MFKSNHSQTGIALNSPFTKPGAEPDLDSLTPVAVFHDRYTVSEDQWGIFHIWNSVEDVWEKTFLSINRAVQHCHDTDKKYTFITLGASNHEN